MYRWVRRRPVPAIQACYFYTQPHQPVFNRFPRNSLKPCVSSTDQHPMLSKRWLSTNEPKPEKKEPEEKDNNKKEEKQDKKPQPEPSHESIVALANVAKDYWFGRLHENDYYKEFVQTHIGTKYPTKPTSEDVQNFFMWFGGIGSEGPAPYSRKPKRFDIAEEKKEPKEDQKKDTSEKTEDKQRKPEVIAITLTWKHVLAGFLLAYVPLAITWHFFFNQSASMDFTQFIELVLPNKMVERIVIDEHADFAHVQLFENNYLPRKITIPIGSYETFEKRVENAQLELGWDPTQFIPIEYKRPSQELQFLSNIFPLALAALIFYLASRGMKNMPPDKILGIGKAGHHLAGKKDIKIRFEDVAGLDEAKQEVEEFVQFLKEPEKYRKLGARIPKGALLVGPPGTGKTLLAKAIAGEAGVPFFSISGSDFIEMFVGVGPSRVRDLFKEARKNTPCIVFIDEIDAVGRARSKSGFSNDERESTLNALLVEMDGFSSSTEVIVLAGTNRVDMLDKALLRPGRFDRRITIDLPDIRGRKQIFDVHLKNLKLAQDKELYSKRFSAYTPGFSGADIANVCNEAALIAVRMGDAAVDIKHFEAALDRIIGGLEKKTRVLGKDEKKRVAYHEAGHAICGWFLEHADPLLKVSIIPRGVAALGYAQMQPKDAVLYSKEQILDRVCMTLGGRAAEEVFLGNISTGAQDDLQRVTGMIYSQLLSYGMSDQIGQISYRGLMERQGELSKPFSEETAKEIDTEARNMVAFAYERTKALLQKNKDQVITVAERLLEKEVLTREDMIELVGKRPYKEHVSFDEILQSAGQKS